MKSGTRTWKPCLYMGGLVCIGCGGRNWSCISYCKLSSLVLLLLPLCAVLADILFLPKREYMGESTDDARWGTLFLCKGSPARGDRTVQHRDWSHPIYPRRLKSVLCLLLPCTIIALLSTIVVKQSASLTAPVLPAGLLGRPPPWPVSTWFYRTHGREGS